MSEVAITIDGIGLEGFEATSIARNLDLLADGFSFSGAYNPGDFLAYLLEPPQKEAVLTIDGETYITAISEKWNPGFEQNSSVTNIECRTRPGVLLECQSTAKASTYKGQTFQKIASLECRPFGIICNFPDGDSPPIKRAQRCPTESVFSFLKKLSCNYEFIITSNTEGDLDFIKPSPDLEIVGSLSQGSQPLLSIDTSYDFSKLHSEYTAVGQFPGNPNAIYSVTDPSATQYRPLIFKADAKDSASLQKAAEWRMTKALTAIEIIVKVSGWRDDSENLWRENTGVNLVAPNVYLFSPYDYLIKNVQLLKTESESEVAELTLVMPESYTGKMPRSLPWARQ